MPGRRVRTVTTPTAGINGTPQPYLPADMTVDPKTNYLYIADGYGNRRVLIVDAATGKYVGHFGAYGQNPVDAENTVIGRRRLRGRSVGGRFRQGPDEAQILPQPAALREAVQ